MIGFFMLKNMEINKIINLKVTIEDALRSVYRGCIRTFVFEDNSALDFNDDDEPVYYDALQDLMDEYQIKESDLTHDYIHDIPDYIMQQVPEVKHLYIF